MRTIYFDERWVGPHGIGRFAGEIMRRLPGVVPLNTPVSKLSLLDPAALSWSLREKKDGIYFSPGFNAPLHCKLPMALTLHDLIHLQLPHSLHIRAYYTLIVRPSVRRAHWIFTVSETSRKYIIEWAQIPPERVHVVGNGLSNQFTLEGQTYCTDRPYFLHVGSHAPHKNIYRLLEAFALVRREANCLMLFANSGSSEVLDQIDRLQLREYVRFTGVLSDHQLATIYRGATALTYPSLQEGFGLPVIEAMACGTPVISSDIEAIRETAGPGNALLCNPTDINSIADAMLKTVGNGRLRTTLQTRGRPRAQEFSWDKVTEKIVSQLAI